MKEVDPKKFHKLYGPKKQRITYQKTDFLDYVIMTIACMLIVYFFYGQDNFLTYIGIALCIFMIWVFPKRHGMELTLPIIFRNPLEIVFSLIHKVQNLKPMYFVGIAVLLLENYIIYLTPE